MKLAQFFNKKILKNAVFWGNLAKFQYHVETKPLGQVLWNFARTNRRLCALRQYKSKFLIIDTFSTGKVLLVAVVFDDRVEHFSVQVISKIFEFSFILDQSQICISKRLGARAYQSYLLICKNAFFQWDCKLIMFVLILMPFLNELS